jgi:hypothetical protein
VRRRHDLADNSSIPIVLVDHLKSRWLPLGLFGLVTIVLFRDFVFSDAMLVGLDTEGLGYTARAFYADALGRGNFPGWNPFILGGTPFLASLAGGDSLYPLSAPLLLVMETYRALGWKLVLHVFLAGAGMYGWARALGVGRWAATIAGLGYLVAPHFVTLVFPAHDGKMFVVALTPWLFWAVHAWFRSGRLTAWAGIGVVVALVTLTTHFQMAYFLFLATGAYGVFLAFAPDGDSSVTSQEAEASGPAGTLGSRRTSVARFIAFFAASVVGVGLAAPQFLPALDYITSDSRRTATTTAASPEENKLYAASYSLHPEEAMSLLIPEFIGSSALQADWGAGTYWGRNPIKFNHEYLGLVLLLLAAVGFVAIHARRLRWFFLGMGGLAFLYALGANTPVWHVAYAVLPGVSLFRAASMAIFLTAFAVATLAAFGADRLLSAAEGEGPGSRGEMKVLWTGAGLAGLLFVLAASGSLQSIWTSTIHPSIPAQQAATLAALGEFITRGALVALLLALGTAGLGWAAMNRKAPAAAVFGGLAFLVVVDGARVDDSFLLTKPFDAFGTATPMEQFIADKVDIEPPFRVLDMRGLNGDVRASMFGVELTWGHHPNDLARYRDLIGAAGGGVPNNLLLSENILRLTNTRYVLWPSAQLGDPAQQNVASLANSVVETASELSDGRAYETLYRVDDLPRARLVGEVRVAPDAQAVEALANPTFPIDRMVVSPEALDVELGTGAPLGGVEWVERLVDEKTLRVTTDRPALLVVAENWYGGWQASVNGEPAEVHRVNVTQQAVAVPEGASEVVLVHRDADVRRGAVVSLLSGLLLFAVAGAGVARRRSRSASVEDDDPTSTDG